MVGPQGVDRREETKAKRRSSFVGTAQFVSPEVLQNKTVTTRYHIDLVYLVIIMIYNICAHYLEINVSYLTIG